MLVMVRYMLGIILAERIGFIVPFFLRSLLFVSALLLFG